tara:strand:+ start:105 stop:1664 length:1560 start_codon:yes stop_codon:yes gene_type:complete
MVLFLLSLLACNDYLVAGIEKRQQEILVHPEHINFGHLKSGHESGQDTFQIINTGDKELKIFSPELVSGNSRFTLNASEELYVVEPGELLEFEVGYTPATYESNGAYIEIISDDEDEPVSVITLEGYGDAPVMTVDPDIFDYGDISIGCDNEERVTIRNEGNLDLTVESVIQMVSQPADIAMEYGSLPEPPWVLIPGQEIDFLVSYIPSDIGRDESSITIKGDDPLNPEQTVVQYGDGDVEQWHTDQWQQDEIPVLDVLWVIDNSGSMMPFQTNLSTNIGSFMNAFSTTGADYRMSVITTDRSTFSTIIDTTHPDPEAALSSLVLLGTYGSGIEKGIQMAYNSLSDPNAAGPGGSFFRESAKLIVIFVSDEPDHSSPGWSSYLTFFDAVKPAGDFIPYGVIGDYPAGCQYQHNGYFRTAQAGEGYWDLIDHYGGNWYSICASDWGVQLQDLAGEVTARRVFKLTEDDPIENTIEVYVNGQQTTDWEYDEDQNAVIFEHGYEPSEGQTIDIEYASWGCGT